jgi:hypothetical protein
MTMDLSVPAWLLAVIVVVSAGAGYASCYFGVVKIGRALMRRSTNKRGDTMKATRNVTTGFVLIVVLIAMLVVLAGATLAYYIDARDDDADMAAQAECIADWGDELVTTITTRGEAGAAYDAALSEKVRASDRRDDATAHVLAVVLAGTAEPGSVDRADFTAALERAQRADEQVRAARATLREARKDLRQARDENTYEPPRLACPDQEEADQ